MGKKILIIDDHSDIREMYEFALKAHGYNVYSAENGITGVQSALEFKPDLILLDIMMPEMDGFTVLSTLQNSKETPTIIIISNLDGKEYIKKALDSGASKYMLKSEYTPDEVVAEIDKIYSNK
jgi:DNA-binding response OmpR family regulator